MKFYRRFIRIDDKLEASPKFTRKSDADEWYRGMLKKKHFDKQSMDYRPGDTGLTVIQYARKWLTQREKDYPRATTLSDEQRLRDYILPVLAEKPIARVTSADVQDFLRKISQAGFRRPGFRISENTRTRVKALLSAIFADAQNESPPLVTRNPVTGVQVKERRRGKAKPKFLATTDDCLKFLRAAKEIGGDTFVACAILIMSGLRKQELIALRWSSVDLEGAQLCISEKYEQASNSILRGTKAGELVARFVPIPKELVIILANHSKHVKFGRDGDFVLTQGERGRHYYARSLSNLIEAARVKSGLTVTTHGLRHTYGREFAMRTGNIKALQAILGHSSSQTTDLYSDLGGERIRGFGESVSFDISVKKSGG